MVAPSGQAASLLPPYIWESSRGSLAVPYPIEWCRIACSAAWCVGNAFSRCSRCPLSPHCCGFQCVCLARQPVTVEQGVLADLGLHTAFPYRERLAAPSAELGATVHQEWASTEHGYIPASSMMKQTSLPVPLMIKSTGRPSGVFFLWMMSGDMAFHLSPVQYS